jgi:ketosteroid isomerase-like protein
VWDCPVADAKGPSGGHRVDRRVTSYSIRPSVVLGVEVPSRNAYELQGGSGSMTSNVSVIRAFNEAEDIETMLDLLDSDVEWRLPESLPWGGTFHGHDGFRRFCALVNDQLAEAHREKEQYLDGGDQVIVLLQSVGRAEGGTEFQEPEVDIYDVRNGKIVGVEIYVDSAMVLRALPERSSATRSRMTVLRSFYDAVARGDVDAIFDLLDPQVVWRTPESLPWGGTFHGHEGLRQFFAKLISQPVEARREVQRYIDTGDRIIVQLRTFGRPKEDTTETDVPEVHVWTVRNGKIDELEAIFDTETAVRAWRVQPIP